MRLDRRFFAKEEGPVKARSAKAASSIFDYSLFSRVFACGIFRRGFSSARRRNF
jgi:hypothetical protein